MIILCQTYHSSFFFSYVTFVFYNILPLLYHMDMINFVLTSSRHNIYRISYNDSTFLCCNSILGVYYYFSDLRDYFISMVTATFVLTSYLPIYNIMVPPVLSPMTESAYKFFFPVYFYFAFMLNST